MKTLTEYRREIRQQVPWIGIKPYSHNLIGLTLGCIAEEYGETEANKAIKDFGLDKLGWSKKESP